MKTKFICRKPGPRSVKVIQRDQKVISSSMAREYSFVYKKAKGCYIWDADGRRYLDFSASVAVMNIGHTNPVIEKAIHKQIKYGIHSAFPDFYTELPVQFAEKLLSFLPGFGKVFLSNSGTEAVECAYKLARWHSKKKWTIAFKGAFHGRTMGSLSMTYSKPVQRQHFGPFLPVKHVSYPDVYRMGEEASNICLNELERTIKKTKDIASIFLEPMQGEGGYVVPPREFIRGVRKLCDEHDILLCDDEVQSGCWRTGTFLAIEHFRVKPDIISMSKAIGGGIPLGATISTNKVMDWPRGAHSNTFGGNLLACTAGIASLDFMKRKRLGENAKRIGKVMMKRLEEIKENHEIVGDVRGIGLMIGVEIVKNKRNKVYGEKERAEILCKASEKGLLLLPAGKSTIRICPPLIITKEQALRGLDIFEDSVKELSRL